MKTKKTPFFQLNLGLDDKVFLQQDCVDNVLWNGGFLMV